MSAAVVRTVLGDVAPGDLGVCNAHDHLFLRSVALPGQELDDPAAALADADRFRAAGGQAIVQWTPSGMGRRPRDLAAIAERTGLHLVAATGMHQLRHCPQPDRPTAAELASRFVADLTDGIGDTGVRAGLIKVAGAYHRVDAHARSTMIAAATAHIETGASIGVHLEGGTAALDVLDLLCGELDVPAQSVILGHLNRFPDRRVQRAAAERGAFLAFDGPSRANHATDWMLLDELAALIDAGHTEQLLIGGDTVTAAARAAGDGPGMRHLLEVLRPRLVAEFGAAHAEAMFVTNPARAFALRNR